MAFLSSMNITGSALTAQDIDNSLTMAMAEGSYYRNALTNISSHKATSDTQVEVTLNTADALFANLLTFPVAKLSGSTYIGTGKYVYSAKGESSQDSTILKKNHPIGARLPASTRLN